MPHRCRSSCTMGGTNLSQSRSTLLYTQHFCSTLGVKASMISRIKRRVVLVDGSGYGNVKSRIRGMVAVLWQKQWSLLSLLSSSFLTVSRRANLHASGGLACLLTGDVTVFGDLRSCVCLCWCTSRARCWPSFVGRHEQRLP